MEEAITTARTLLKKHSKDLLSRANVVATGIGFKTAGGERTETPSIICSVEKRMEVSDLSPRDVVPSQLDGVPTDVIETGRIRAFQAPTGRFRPAPGGVSVGHRDITAGTLGCWVHRDGQWMMLSNNHVLADSNNADIGDPILQPGPYDGGSNPGDRIATLEDFVRIHFPGDSNGGNGGSGGCGIAGSIVSVLNGIAAMLGSSTRVKQYSIQQEDNLVDAAIADPRHRHQAGFMLSFYLGYRFFHDFSICSLADAGKSQRRQDNHDPQRDRFSASKTFSMRLMMVV